MTTEAKKRNPDYSNSAVNLTNPVDVIFSLETIHAWQEELSKIQSKIDELIPEVLKDAKKNYENAIATEMASIRELIDQQGSYQDTVNGHYALKMRKVSKQYHAEPFLKYYPEFAPFAVIQTIDAKALDMLVKGKKIPDETELKNIGIITESETYAYVIK